MLIEIGQKAKETSYILGKMGTDLKNAGLLAAAQEILDEEDEILKANAADVAKAKERGMAPGLVDRLELNHKRIEGIVEGMRQVVGLEDPVGEVISMKRHPNGLLTGRNGCPSVLSESSTRRDRTLRQMLLRSALRREML